MRSLHHLVACLVGVVLSIATRVAVAEELVLVKNGVAQLPLVARAGSAPADELAAVLSRMSGASFVRLAATKERGIFVGTREDFPHADLAIEEKLGPEEFVIRSLKGSLFLIGGSQPGVSHAVITLLRDLGCRWYFPGELWEVIPGRTTVAGSWDLREKPDFPFGRRIWYGFGAYAKNRADWENWNRHNRMGGALELSIGHTWAGLNPEKDFKDHPEWFALVDGKRSPGKPCYSHPEVVRKMIAYVRAAAASGRTCVSVSAPDGLGFCECDRCREVLSGSEPFAAHGSLFAKRADGSTVNITSETLFRTVNKVAEAVCGDHPELTIACYAYSAYSHPPSFALHPNVYIQTTTAFRRTPATLAEQLGQFGAKTRKLGIREYYSVYQWDWDWPDPGKLAPEILQRDLKFFHESGVDAVNAEASNNWGARGLGYYLAAQLLWEVDDPLQPLLRDFYTGAFGPAAPAMERYFVRWYGPGAAVSKQAELPARAAAFDKSIDLEVLREAFGDLEAAVRATPGDSRYRARVDALRCYLHYLFLRYRLEKAAEAGDRNGILAAVRAETEFGGRLSDTNLVHSRALLGKAFARRFREFEPLLEKIDTSSWRVVRTPPDSAELADLWEADRLLLAP